MMDMGSHCVDTLEYILGEPVLAVMSLQSTRVHSYDVDDTAVALLEFASGSIGLVETSFAIPDEASLNALEIYGERGSLQAKGTLGQTATGEMASCLVPIVGGYQPQQDRERATLLEEHYHLQGPPLYGEMVRLFSDAVTSGSLLVADGEQGVHNLRVLLGIYESAQTGRKVVV